MKDSEKMYWMKVATAVFLSIICITLQTFLNLDGILVFGLGVMIYLAISDLLSVRMNFERQRGLKIGVGAFIFTWLTLWTLLYTIIKTI